MRTFSSVSILALLFLFASCATDNSNDSKSTEMKASNSAPKKIDWQGHRGARGILPENSIPSFLKALEYPITTLELDVVISKDKKVIVSHDPVFNHAICSKPDGSEIADGEEILLYELTYDEIKAFDCGSKGNENFKEQTAMKVSKPSLMDMVKAVEEHCEKTGRAKPFYNIEIKATEDGYDKKTPAPKEFVALVLAELKELGIMKRMNLQSFDVNTMNEIHAQDPSVVTAYLIENLEGIDENLKKLTFKPDIYSPYFMLVNQSVVEQLHAKGIRLIPWTINKPEMMKKMVDLGVDGIITDYPNLIPEEMF